MPENGDREEHTSDNGAASTDLPVHRRVKVTGVHAEPRHLRVEAGSDTWRARAVISATGTWWRPGDIVAVPPVREARDRGLSERSRGKGLMARYSACLKVPRKS